MNNIYLIVFSILIFIVLLGIFYRILKSYRYEKRLSKYVVSTTKDNRISFFDAIEALVWSIINKFTRILKSFNLFKNYSLRYKRYLSIIRNAKVNTLDIISIKIISGLSLYFITGILLILKYNDLPLIILIASLFIGFYLPDIYFYILYSKRKKIISEDLAKALTMMRHSFSAGSSIIQAIEFVSIELEGPLKEEFAHMFKDLKFGLDLDTVFKRFYERIKIDDVKYITTSLNILNQTGGDIVEVFTSIEKSFISRQKLRNELKATTASASFIYKLLLVMPIILALAITLLNPNYFIVFITDVLGRLILGIIILIYSLYILVIKKIMKIEDY